MAITNTAHVAITSDEHDGKATVSISRTMTASAKDNDPICERDRRVDVECR